MKQTKRNISYDSLGVEEYLAKRRKKVEEEIKKEQEKYPEPFADYSSFLLLSL